MIIITCTPVHPHIWKHVPRAMWHVLVLYSALPADMLTRLGPPAAAQAAGQEGWLLSRRY